MISKQIQLTKEVTIHESSHLSNVTFEDYNEIGIFNFIENSHFGSFSYTGQFCFIQNAQIGKFSNIAACVRIGPTDHPMQRPTLHHFTYRPSMYGFGEENEKYFFLHREKRITYVGHDTWIGHGAIIMPEVKLGHGSVVGSGAIVTKDLPSYAIAVGVPARIVGYRFEEKIVEKLLDIAWWDWDTDLFKDRYLDFRLPIEAFIEKYEGKGK